MPYVLIKWLVKCLNHCLYYCTIIILIWTNALHISKIIILLVLLQYYYITITNITHSNTIHKFVTYFTHLYGPIQSGSHCPPLWPTLAICHFKTSSPTSNFNNFTPLDLHSSYSSFSLEWALTWLIFACEHNIISLKHRKILVIKIPYASKI